MLLLCDCNLLFMSFGLLILQCDDASKDVPLCANLEYSCAGLCVWEMDCLNLQGYRSHNILRKLQQISGKGVTVSQMQGICLSAAYMAHVQDNKSSSCARTSAVKMKETHKAPFYQTCQHPPIEALFFLSLLWNKVVTSWKGITLTPPEQKKSPRAVRSCLSHLFICLNSFHLFYLNLAQKREHVVTGAMQTGSDKRLRRRSERRTNTRPIILGAARQPRWILYHVNVDNLIGWGSSKSFSN